MTKHDKNIDDINDGERLHQWMKEVEDKFDRFDNAYSNITQINKGNWKDSDDIEAGLFKFGKFLEAIKNNDKSKLIEMNTEKSYFDRQANMMRKAQLGTPGTGDSSGTDWAYIVPAYIYDTVIVRFMNEESQLIPLCKRIPMQNRLHRIPTESTSLSWTHVTSEVTSKTESNPTFSYVDLECETFATWVSCTDEVLEDTIVDITRELTLQAVQDLTDEVETQILTSDSAPFLSLLKASTTINGVTSDSTSFADVSWDKMLEMVDALTTKARRRNAVFVMHPTVWSKLISASDAMGKYFYDPSFKGPRTVWGYGLALSDNAPAISDSAVSTAYVVLGNMKYMLYGVRIPLEVRMYRDTAYSATEDENFYRFRTRFGTKISDESAFCKLTSAAS